MEKTIRYWVMWETEEEYRDWKESQKADNTLEDVAFVNNGDVQYDLEYDYLSGDFNIFVSEKNEDGDFETVDEYVDNGFAHAPTLADFIQELVEEIL